MDNKSPFKPAEVLQMHATRQPPADAAPAVPEPAASSLAPEAPAPREETQPPAAMNRSATCSIAMRLWHDRKGSEDAIDGPRDLHYTLLQHDPTSRSCAVPALLTSSYGAGR